MNAGKRMMKNMKLTRNQIFDITSTMKKFIIKHG
jgi:hypothetical protein